MCIRDSHKVELNNLWKLIPSKFTPISQIVYKRINQSDCLKDIVVRQNETTKSAIPAWILRDWANKFNMTFEN